MALVAACGSDPRTCLHGSHHHMSSWLRRTHLPTWQGVREASGVKQSRTGGTHPSRPPLCSGRPGAGGPGSRVARDGQDGGRGAWGGWGGGRAAAGGPRLLLEDVGRFAHLLLRRARSRGEVKGRGQGARARGEVGAGRGGGARWRGGARRGGSLAGSGRLGLGAGARRHAGRARTAASRLAGESRFGLASIEMVEMRMDCHDTRRASAREVGAGAGARWGVRGWRWRRGGGGGAA